MSPNLHPAPLGSVSTPASPLKAASALTAPTTTAATIEQPSPHARRPFLDHLIDDHVTGRCRMPMVERILQALDEAPGPLSLEQLLSAARLPDAGAIFTRLVACCVLEWRSLQPRPLLARPRGALRAGGASSASRQQHRR